jgi:hypothetical protein
MLLLWIAWGLLIISWAIACLREPYSKLDERYTEIEQRLVTQRATLPLKYQDQRQCREHQECTICQLAFQENDLVSRLSGCRHVYHHLCIKRWLLKHSHCPTCRQSFDECIAASSSSGRSHYFCTRDGLRQVSYDREDDCTCRISPEELKQFRDYSISIEDIGIDHDDPWNNVELLQSYGRHMRLPPV